MIDTESNVAREVERQRLVEGILRGLHGAVRDGSDYREDFHALAMILLANLAPGRRQDILSEDEHREIVRRLVDGPIEAFAAGPEEAATLRLEVFEKVFGSVSANVRQRMLRVELGLPQLRG